MGEMEAWPIVLGVPSISILSRDPSFQETIQNPGETAVSVILKRTMVEKNGESTPRLVLHPRSIASKNSVSGRSHLQSRDLREEKNALEGSGNVLVMPPVEMRLQDKSCAGAPQTCVYRYTDFGERVDPHISGHAEGNSQTPATGERFILPTPTSGQLPMAQNKGPSKGLPNLHGCGSKICSQNGALVNGNMD